MGQTIANFIFDQSMNPQALAVLALLWRESPEKTGAVWDETNRRYSYYQETHAWHNGREQGFSLVASRSLASSKNTCIVCAENRNSDNIVVYHWFNESTLNPPTIHNSGWSDKVYRENSKFFNEDDIAGARDYILELIKKQLVEIDPPTKLFPTVKSSTDPIST